ncbi:putative rhamnosyl transferase [Thalassococcus sp. CAU 1522]|uniref:Rhamnosyl transferase n=1 Tax=Thalassococcus arenae TaxID=2851652 RepID=A0ABS6N751_9RHOB|nr:putative rhamnosyl transferase [Thalassococcus arenae]MBV2359832.1 putative rhamnosyl transferase [Thalassococcus arenae]
MQVIGLCRFSYPAEGGFQVEHADAQARAAYLYAPERMEERFRTFEAITLPGLRGQTDPDFTFVILIGEDLPEPFAERLFSLVAEMPQAVIVARPPGPHRPVCKSVLNAARHDPDSPCIQFRMDDDDSVSFDFVARVRHDAETLAPLCAQNKLVVIDYNRGYLLRPGADGIRAEECVLPYYPMGMAMVVQGGCGQSIMNFAHGKVAQFMPTVTFTDAPMYVRGHNDFNDSRQKKHVKPIHLPRPSAETAAALRERFGITDEIVRQVFA